MVSGTDNNPRAYRITKAFYYEYDNVRELKVSGVYIDFQGYEFGTIERTFVVMSFKGLEFIKDCGVFPLEYHPNREIVRKALLERGRKFISLKGKQHRIYAGPLDRSEVYRRRHSEPKMGASDEAFEVCMSFMFVPYIRAKNMQISSDIIVDTITYNRLHAQDSIKTTAIPQDKLVNGELTDSDLMICTDRVPFFSLHDKDWHKGNIMNIHEKVFNEQIFSQLVLPDATKRLLLALVRTHTKGSNFDDFVKGTIIYLLFHLPSATS
jgi:hypothetical protein